MNATPFYGFGLGLRTPHYADFELKKQPVDWLEVITDNFLVSGGKPHQKLLRFREDYPIALHGVAMSIGSAQGLDVGYIKRVKALADGLCPMWVSDHLCWTGLANKPLHDLYPLPYTEETAALIIRHLRTAQDILERRMLIENVSSYLRYSASVQTEWAFLRYILEEADCDLLLDVNNIFVSSVNHGFQPDDFLAAMPASRVKQIHLAGHSYREGFIIDTHDAPIIPEVWAIYAKSCARFGAVSTMIERDDHIPALGELIEELNHARAIAQDAGISLAPNMPWQNAPATTTFHLSFVDAVHRLTNAPALNATQHTLVDFILQSPANSAPLIPVVVDAGDSASILAGDQGLAIYHNAYRMRLTDVLADSYSHLARYMGEYFQQIALDYVEQHSPEGRQLGTYGAALDELLAKRYPDDVALAELAQLEWALRRAFDAANATAWTTSLIEQQGAQACLQQSPVLTPSFRILKMLTNAMAIWKAIEDDVAVPVATKSPEAKPVAVWRWGVRPHFVSLQPEVAAFLTDLAQPHASINSVAEQWIVHHKISDPEVFAGWLRDWWQMEMLALPQD